MTRNENISRTRHGTNKHIFTTIEHEMNGNNCETILDNADLLWNETHKYCKFELQPLVDTLRALAVVIHSCFGMELSEGWKANIQHFAKTWENLVDFFDTYPFEEPQSKIMYTEKVHVLIHHVPQYCTMYNTGLGVWSEQAGESLHKKRRKHKENYRNVGKHILEDKELHALKDFNAKQI